MCSSKYKINLTIFVFSIIFFIYHFLLRNFMKFKSIFLNSILVVIGFLMLIMPKTCLKAVIVVLGIAGVIGGFYTLINTIRSSMEKSYKKNFFLKAFIEILIGLLAIIFPFALANSMVVVWNIITYIFAAILLVFAFYGFYTASKLKGVAGYDRKQISSESLLCILFAVLLILIPIKAVGILLIRIIGVIGILIGIFAIVIEIIAWKNKSDYEVVISDSEDDSPSTQE